MLRAQYCIATVAGILAVHPVAVAADAIADAKRAIQAQYDKINAAVARKDVKALDGFYAPGYEYVSMRGEKLTLPELEKGLAPLLAHASALHGKTIVQSISLAAGTIASARIQYTGGFTSVIGGNPPRTAIYESRSTAEDVWIRGTRGWILKRTRQLTDHKTVNGVSADEGPEQPQASRKR